MALCIVAAMFPKPHFLHRGEPIHTNIAHKITYSKFDTVNWPHSIRIPQNEGAMKKTQVLLFDNISLGLHLVPFHHSKSNCIQDTISKL